jgi:hypothetical protein
MNNAVLLVVVLQLGLVTVGKFFTCINSSLYLVFTKRLGGFRVMPRLSSATATFRQFCHTNIFRRNVSTCTSTTDDHLFSCETL